MVMLVRQCKSEQYINKQYINDTANNKGKQHLNVARNVDIAFWSDDITKTNVDFLVNCDVRDKVKANNT